MKTLIITLSILIFVNLPKLSAQDIHFSKYYDTPLILNPANTGNYNGNWRISSNYRKQGINFIEPYHTTALSAEHPLYFLNEKFSIGAYFINDKAASSTFNTNKLFLSSGYFRKISKNSYLHIGFQAGYVNKKYSNVSLTFPDQFDNSTGHFNSQLYTNEQLLNQKTSYLDLNWGLMWSRKTKKSNTEIGIGMFHYNMPEESFSYIQNKLEPKYIFHAKTEKLICKSFSTEPQIIFVFQNKANEALIGFDNKYILEQNNKISLCFYLRKVETLTFNSAIVKAGIKHNCWNVSISYDFDIADKPNTTGINSAFEISLIYITEDINFKNKNIPCEIF